MSDSDTGFLRFIGQAGGIPSLDALPAERKLQLAEIVQHVAMVQMLIKNGGSFIVEAIGEPGAVERWLRFKFAMRGTGDGRIEIRLCEEQS